MRPADRGVSAVLGVVLLLAIILTGMAVTVVIGATALDQTKDQLGVDRAEKTLTQLDSKSAVVALGSSNHQSVSLAQGSGSDYTVEQERGWMNVSIENTTSGTVTPIVNTTLGAVVYENGQVELAYQGGGVWKNTEGGTTMISPPEFHFRNATLTLPIIAVGGEQGIGGTAEISKNGPTIRKFANESHDASFTNPLESGRVTVTVQSEYYEAWGRYFEQRTEGGVSYAHDENQVTLTLLQQDSNRKIENALSVQSGSDGTLVIQSGDTVVVESYSSTTISDDQKSKPSSSGTKSDVNTTLDVNFKGNSEIGGNLSTDGTVDFGGGKSGVTGNLRYGEGTVSSKDCGKYVGGWCAKNASSRPPTDIGNKISSRIDDLKGANNNTGEPCLSASDALKYGDGSCSADAIELDAGDYYVSGDDLKVDQQKLVLNTTGGDIRIALDNDRAVKFQKANVTVKGDGRVSVFATKRVEITKKRSTSPGSVWNRGWDSYQFWLYCDVGCHVDLTNGAVFNGVVYAPPGPGGSGGDLEIRQGAKVFGAVVSGGGTNAELGQNSEIYFDQSLKSTRVFTSPTVPSISYLHISVNRLNVTG
jgi:hypothetical protein